MIQRERPHDEPSAVANVPPDANDVALSRARTRPGDTLPETPTARRERAVGRELMSGVSGIVAIDKGRDK